MFPVPLISSPERLNFIQLWNWCSVSKCSFSLEGNVFEKCEPTLSSPVESVTGTDGRIDHFVMDKVLIFSWFTRKICKRLTNNCCKFRTNWQQELWLILRENTINIEIAEIALEDVAWEKDHQLFYIKTVSTKFNFNFYFVWKQVNWASCQARVVRVHWQADEGSCASNFANITFAKLTRLVRQVFDYYIEKKMKGLD